MTDEEPDCMDREALVQAVEYLLSDIDGNVPTPEQWERLKQLMEIIY